MKILFHSLVKLLSVWDSQCFDTAQSTIFQHFMKLEHAIPPTFYSEFKIGLYSSLFGEIIVLNFQVKIVLHQRDKHTKKYRKEYHTAVIRVGKPRNNFLP